LWTNVYQVEPDLTTFNIEPILLLFCHNRSSSCDKAATVSDV